MFEVDIRAIEVDDVHGFVYWSDDRYIKQATLNGSNTKVVISDTGKSNVTSLQIIHGQFLLYLFATSCAMYLFCLHIVRSLFHRIT